MKGILVAAVILMFTAGCAVNSTFVYSPSELVDEEFTIQGTVE